MRHTAKITLVIGFTVSSVVTLILKRTGTGFKTMTMVLYLYGFVCLGGGFIGYRKAFLKHGEDIEDPGFWEITGIRRLKKFLTTTSWTVKTVENKVEAEKIRVHGKLVSMKLENGKELSYPRKSVERIEKSSP